MSRAPGVVWAGATAVSRDRELTKVEIVTNGDPFAAAAADAVPALRDAHARSGRRRGRVLGGPAAERYDARAALARTPQLIVPLTLVLVLLIIGAARARLRRPAVPRRHGRAVLRVRARRELLSSRTCSATASDPALPTFAFVFLVALGVDYNVFLISRIREEREQRDSRDAVISGLERSGGVITSAGLILAGTFLELVAVDIVWPGPGRLHGRARPARGHVPRALLPRPRDRRRCSATAAGGR